MRRARRAPVAQAAAGDVARAEREVGAAGDAVEQRGQVGRVVREVGVHLDHVPAPRAQRVLEARHVGAAEAGLARPVEDLDVVARGRQRVGDLAGPVGRAVVDHQHADARAARRSTRVHERLEVLGLVVGGEDDPGRHERRVGYATSWPT